jgi:V-type H+-transporting ATPase subunit G
MSTNKVL